MSKWEMVALADVATIERSIVQPDQIRPGTVYIGLENIESGGAILDPPRVKPGDVASAKFDFSSDHLLYSKLRPNLGKIACPDFGGVCSTDILPVLPDPRLDRRFLFHYLRRPETVAHASQRAVGVNLPRLSPSALGAIQIPLPPLPEQHRIAAVLDRAEALLANRRAAILTLQAFEKSIFLEMFGDPILNSRSWPTKSLDKIGTLDRGVSKHRPRNDPSLLGGPYPLIQTGDIANCDGYIRTYQSSYSELGLRQSKMWPPGTLCITIAANIAKAGILTFDACFPDSIVGFTSSKRETIEYVRVWLGFLQERLEGLAPESAQKNINLSMLRSLKVPWPDVGLQTTFFGKIQANRAIVEHSRASLTALDSLFSSLQHRAFRGEL